MKKINFVLISLVAVAIALSCSAKKETSSKRTDSLATADSLKKINPPEAVIPKDTALDNAARFIAGLPQSHLSSFSKLESDSYWTEFKTSMDGNWKKMYDTRLTKISDWENSTLSQAIQDSLSLFYPFSGPDFLHAYFLFPRTKVYMLTALESIKEVPQLDSMSLKNRDQFLDSLGNSLRDIFQKSYFITNHMQKDLKKVKGVLPPLYFFIERSGHEILAQKFITIDGDGKETEVPAKKLNWQKIPGVKLTIRNLETKEIKTVYYFSLNIANNGIRDRPEFVKFVKGKAPFNTFVKSASYLMHQDPFSAIRELIIKNSVCLLQDDTGIPYKYFKNKLEWRGIFFGDYVKPVEDFSRSLFQVDLDSAYKKGHQDLPFSLGYHWSTRKQNYMLFAKSLKLDQTK